MKKQKEDEVDHGNIINMPKLEVVSQQIGKVLIENKLNDLESELVLRTILGLVEFNINEKRKSASMDMILDNMKKELVNKLKSNLREDL